MASAPSEAVAAAHFTGAFLARVPAPLIVGLLERLAQGAPWRVEQVTPSNPSRRALAAVVRSAAGRRLSVRLSVAQDRGDGIDDLLFLPATDPANSWDDVRAMARDVAPDVNLLAAEIDGQRCAPLASIEPTKPLALGSTFKLYILDALVSQIASGKRRWDEPVAIQARYKSLPPGAMRDEPEGKAFSVRHFAELAISASDNTAADHLLAFVGRDAVEGAVKASGHAEPARLVPFLSTRELFALKLLASTDGRSAYIAADVARKRALLEAYDRFDPAEMLAHADSFTRPVSIDFIEWHASPEDLCKLMAQLHARAQEPATAAVRDILSISPGLGDDKSQYSYIGYKGGSEPGVFNMTWLLQRARDQKWLFLTVGYNDSKSPLNESKAIAIAANARELLGR
jgi:hypothetical protein